MSEPLTLQQIFSSDQFADEGFDRPRWCGNESFYTTLRKVVLENSGGGIQTGSSSDLTMTTAADTPFANTTAYEIIWHDASTGSSSILVNVSQLIAEGSSKPLIIDDYSLATDRSKVLLFTDAQKVWRYKTRGSYWILDMIPQRGLSPLRRLGGKNSCNSDLMFATFSPDSSKVAYVRNHNIYVEDLLLNESIAVTTDGSGDLINGTFDWVYEEEFQIRNGFR